MSALRGKADMTWKCRHFRFWPRYGHWEVLAKLALCKNLDLCTNSLTHIKCCFMLCILYVQNGERYGGLPIRAGGHGPSILVPPIIRAKSSKKREDILGEKLRRSLRPQTTIHARYPSRTQAPICCTTAP